MFVGCKLSETFNMKLSVNKKREAHWVQRNRDRSNDRYHKLVNENHFISHAESMLKHLSEQHGLGVPIPDQKFLEVNFPFGVITSIIEKYSQRDFVVGKYCYTIFNNGTIKINLI